MEEAGEVSSIDWTATGTMIAGLGSWVGAGALLYAAHVGKQTVASWRNQQLAAREIALAEDISHSSLKATRALFKTFSFFEKISADEEWEMILDRYLRARLYLESKEVLFESLHDMEIRGYSIFGADLQQALDDIINVRFDVLKNLQWMSDLEPDVPNGPVARFHVDQFISEEPGSYQAALHGATLTLFKTLQPVLGNALKF